MRRSTRLIPMLIGVALALVAPLLPATDLTPVVPASAKVDVPFAVKPGLLFNDVGGSRAAQYRIVTQVEQAIDHAPKGSTIRMAQYLFNLPRPADKLIAAHQRGVNVQLLIDDYPTSAQTQRLRDALGTRKTARSFVARCKNSCMASTPSVMHAKFFLFSQSGRSRNVSMVSSANLYTGNTTGSWNNLHTIVGDERIYDSLNQYFADMLPDRDNRNYIRTTASGKFKLYYFPRTARPGTKQVVLLDVLNHVRCTGVARGYGSNGRTVVRVAQWGWSSARLDIARRLWTLHDQGCNVQIIGNGFKTGDRVLQTLLKPSRNGRMRFYDAAVNVTGDPRREYMHHKVVAVSGVWFGHRDTKVVYTGSANFTEPGTSSNNELVMRVLDGPTYDAYARNFAMIRDDHTRRVTKAPTTSVAQAARKDAALDRELETGLDRG